MRGVVLVGRGDDLQLATVDHQPGPSGTEPADAGGLELGLEVGKGTERGRDGFRELTGRRASLGRGEDVPEEGVVPMAAPVVADRSADVLGHARDVGDQGLDGLAFERSAGEGLVQVVHVGLVMTAVVDLHRQGVDVGFEGVLGIGKRGEFVSHRCVC